MCAVSPVVHTSNISGCKKKIYIFVITENIMKHPVVLHFIAY